MSNSVLDAMRNRRSVARFDNTPIEEDKLQAILEAGRWAPSWLNKQPWSFVVVADQKTKQLLSEVIPTAFVQGLREAPVCIVIIADPEQDPYHYVEDGAAAAQNMALAAYSLGLGSSWIGVYDAKNQKGSADAKVKDILNIPKNHHVIAVLPIGKAKFDAAKKERKELRQIIFHEKFGQR